MDINGGSLDKICKLCSVVELTEQLDCKSTEIKWYKYMKVDPWLRSLWLILAVYEVYKGGADATLWAASLCLVWYWELVTKFLSLDEY